MKNLTYILLFACVASVAVAVDFIKPSPPDEKQGGKYQDTWNKGQNSNKRLGTLDGRTQALDGQIGSLSARVTKLEKEVAELKKTVGGGDEQPKAEEKKYYD